MNARKETSYPTLYWALGLLCAFVLGTVGCRNRSIKVSGEVFTHDSGATDQVRHHPGTIVYFLSNEENFALKAIADKRQKELTTLYQSESLVFSNSWHDAFRTTSNLVLKAELERLADSKSQWIDDERRKWLTWKSDVDFLLRSGAAIGPGSSQAVIDAAAGVEPDYETKYKKAIPVGQRSLTSESLNTSILRSMPPLYHPTRRDVLSELDRDPVAGFLSDKLRATADSDGGFAIQLNSGQRYWILAQTPRMSWYFPYVPDGVGKLVLSDSNRRRDQ